MCSPLLDVGGAAQEQARQSGRCNPKNPAAVTAYGGAHAFKQCVFMIERGLVWGEGRTGPAPGTAELLGGKDGKRLKRLMEAGREVSAWGKTAHAVQE